jgi:hypothetical protein
MPASHVLADVDMQWFRTSLVIALAAAGCDKRPASTRDQVASPRGSNAPPASAHPTQSRHDERSRSPRVQVSEIGAASLCVTKGKLTSARVLEPTFRAVALGKSGDAMDARLVVRGKTAETRALASGQERRQVGLKLRAEDGCNLVYAMWRLDPKPMIEVSVKRNPGQRTHAECGPRGYTKVKPELEAPLPALDDGQPHTLRAEIVDDRLIAWVDNQVVWEGALPADARDLAGPPGLRSDNLDVELLALATDARLPETSKSGDATCIAAHSD